MLLRDDLEAARVVDVLVCDENRRDPVKRGADLAQRLFYGARTDAGIDEKLCVGGFDIYAVAGGAGKKGIRRKLIHDIPRRRRTDGRRARSRHPRRTPFPWLP